MIPAAEGSCVHLRMVTTLSGAAPLTKQEAIEEAKAQAFRRNPDIEALAVALSHDAAHGYRPHRSGYEGVRSAAR